MPHIRRLLSPLTQIATYTRWVHLILGGVVFMPYLIAVAVLASLILASGGGPGSGSPGAALVVGLAPALGLVAATAWLPGVRTMSAHLVRALVTGALAAEEVAEASTRRSRMRTGLWLVVHLSAGFAVCLATMLGLTQSAVLAATAVAPDPAGLMEGSLYPAGGEPPAPAERIAAPFAGAALLLAVIYTVAGAGALMARLAPVLLGPSAAERLAAAQQRVETLAERNRLARELHDSIGHALSAVTLQAGTAARVIDTDPAFTRSALEAIAEQARTATAELDHVLGLLRDERPSTAPQRDLAHLDQLVEATRAVGAEVTADVEGDPAAVPGVVSRETYRICQEGLTNVLRHAGPVPVALRLRVGAHELEVEITNPTAHPAPAGAGRNGNRGGGRGLRGMDERLRLLGGTLQAGAADGQWRLRAAVSWRDAQ
ncbi:sensor histidine kinase [Streptomonospora wellingtoniae]|uniref:histidine kinase n=1 Tax=Streptomonospora wellingtoniae TaxID=3075544 RepID=A0ABU2KWR7_9ACTN|nr:histidine kinase [Streptomonospora sp. DSM 45055]MDT0303745.1 histidine kinase [Streptomonospora sp. DSM 45055]